MMTHSSKQKDTAISPNSNMRAVITVVIVLRGLNSSSTDSEVSVWKRGRMVVEGT